MNVYKDFADFSITIYDKDDTIVKAWTFEAYHEAKSYFDALTESSKTGVDHMILSGMGRDDAGYILGNYRF